MKVSSESQLNFSKNTQNEISMLEAQKRQLQSQIQQLKSNSANNESQIDTLKKKTADNEAKIQRNQSQIESISMKQEQKNISTSPAYIVELSMHHQASASSAIF